MDRSGWKSRYRFVPETISISGGMRASGGRRPFHVSRGCRGKKVLAGQGRADKWMGFKRRNWGERAFFIGRERGWSTLRALSNCIPEGGEGKAKQTSSSNFSRGVEILIDNFHKRRNVGRSMLVGNVGKGGEERTWRRKLCSVRSRGKRHVRRVVAFLAAHSPGETIRKTREK